MRSLAITATLAGLITALVGCGATAQVNQEMIAKVAAGEVTEAHASWWGFNEEDATEALQAAINSGAPKLRVENMGRPWIVRPLLLASNQEIVFEEGCELLAKRGEFKDTNASLVTGRGVENVTISGYNATWRMWRDDYDNPELYTKAEWRHCLTLRDTNNVTILGLTLAESGGDGIYFGAGGDGNRNTTIRDVVLDKNYRQGISVITAENLLIEDTIMSNTAGTPPAAGIDFEPNHADEKVVNVVMRNCVTENNQGDGFEFYLPNMNADTADVSVTIENCRSVNDRSGVRIITANGPGDAVGGFIRFVDTQFVGSVTDAIMVGDNPAEGGLEITFENCVVENPVPNNPEAAPIVFAARQRAVQDIGGVDLGRLVLRDPIEREPISYSSQSLGINLVGVRGTLAIERNGEQTEIELTPETLEQWAPKSDILTVPLVRLDEFEYAPVVAAPPAAALLAPNGFYIRRSGSAMRYAEAGDEVVVTAQYAQVGRNAGTTAPVTVTSPSGEQVTVCQIPFEGEGEVRFTALETGLYELYAEPGGNRMTFTSSSHPLNLVADDGPIQLIAGGGSLYVWVPEGTTEFGLVASGGGGGEGVRAALYNPAGELVQDEDDAGGAVLLRGVLDQPSEGEAWRLEVLRPTELYFEDHSISVRGIPPLLAPSPEALLMPR